MAKRLSKSKATHRSGSRHGDTGLAGKYRRALVDVPRKQAVYQRGPKKGKLKPGCKFTKDGDTVCFERGPSTKYSFADSGPSELTETKYSCGSGYRLVRPLVNDKACKSKTGDVPKRAAYRTYGFACQSGYFPVRHSPKTGKRYAAVRCVSKAGTLSKKKPHRYLKYSEKMGAW